MVPWTSFRSYLPSEASDNSLVTLLYSACFFFIIRFNIKFIIKNDATFDATKGDLYAMLLESAEKHEVELSFEKRIVLQPPASE